MTRRERGVYKRGSAYWIDYTDLRGRRHREPAGLNYRLAVLALRQWQADIQAGKFGLRHRGRAMTLQAFVDRHWRRRSGAAARARDAPFLRGEPSESHFAVLRHMAARNDHARRPAGIRSAPEERGEAPHAQDAQERSKNASSSPSSSAMRWTDFPSR